MKKSEKIGLVILGIVVLSMIVYIVLGSTVLRSYDCSIKNSEGYIQWLNIYNGKLYYVHDLFGSKKEVLYCYDDENGLYEVSSEESERLIPYLMEEYFKGKTQTNNAGMEGKYDSHMEGYVLKEPITTDPKATYRSVGEGHSMERFPYEDYKLAEYYYGLTDEYIVGIMRAVQKNPNKEEKDYIALVDKTGKINVIPGYSIYTTFPDFLFCHDNCVYFWGVGEEEGISVGEGEGGVLKCEGPRLYVYIVDTGEVRKLCDYSNLCRASDLYKAYVVQWSIGDEYEVFIDGDYLYSYSKNGDTDIVRFRFTYDENSYPVKCEYDACIYDNPNF